MDNAQRDAMLAKPNNAVVGVNRANSAPQLTVVWYAWDGKDFYFSTTKARAKYVNIMRDPAISLIIDDPASHTYVAAYGRAEIITENQEPLARKIIERYASGSQAEAMIKGTVNDPTRVIVVLHPEKIIA